MQRCYLSQWCVHGEGGDITASLGRRGHPWGSAWAKTPATPKSLSFCPSQKISGIGIPGLPITIGNLSLSSFQSREDQGESGQRGALPQHCQLPHTRNFSGLQERVSADIDPQWAARHVLGSPGVGPGIGLPTSTGAKARGTLQPGMAGETAPFEPKPAGTLPKENIEQSIENEAQPHG